MQAQELYQKYLSSGKVVCTDTRKLIPGSVFFALKGANFNGNRFAGQALEQGCAYAVTDEDTGIDDSRIIRVEDALHALQMLAREHRRALNLPVIAIGGSNGKTTTKELTAAVLSKKYRVWFTQGNLNNQIGVPLTLLSVPEGTEILVIEMGANKIGDMEELCAIAEPDYGLITNIGKEHLEGFGDLEGVARGESELYYWLQKHNGLALVNADDEWLMRMASRLPRRETYGTLSGTLVRGTATQLNPAIRFSLETAGNTTAEATAHLSGDYNFSNMLTAAAIGVQFGVQAEDIVAALCDYQPKNNRSQWIFREGREIFMDAYNANPSSMEVAIRNFSAYEKGPKTVILGDMFEMGEHAPEEHRNIAALCDSLPVEQVLLAGKEFSGIQGLSAKFRQFEKTEDLVAWITAGNTVNPVVMLKASRGMYLEKVLEVL